MGWRNAQLRGRLPRAFVRWCMCEHALSISLRLFVCLFFSPPDDIKTLAGKTGLANACAGTEHTNADKVGQESTTRMFWLEACVCVCVRVCVTGFLYL